MKKTEIKPEAEAVVVSPPVVVPDVKPEEKTEEVKEEVLVDKPMGVRLEAVEVQPEAVSSVNSAEGLGASIDNLAKIVDQGEVTATVAEPAEQKTGSKLVNISAVVLAFLLGLGSGFGVGYYVWGKGETKTADPGKTVQPTISQPAPTKAATSPTPTVKPVNKSQLKIQVLNGTDSKGVAAKARDVLVAAGYSGVTVGNAENSDYEMTEISIKQTKKAYLEELSKDLTDGKYTLGSQVRDLPENSEYDAVVVIGSK